MLGELFRTHNFATEVGASESRSDVAISGAKIPHQNTWEL
jgi:hypothetical protein